MDGLQKVDGYANLRKDSHTGGVVNIDKSSYNAHLKAKAIAQKQLLERTAMRVEIDTMRDEINTIKSDVSDIKNMLMQLINKGQ